MISSGYSFGLTLLLGFEHKFRIGFLVVVAVFKRSYLDSAVRAKSVDSHIFDIETEHDLMSPKINAHVERFIQMVEAELWMMLKFRQKVDTLK